MVVDSSWKRRIIVGPEKPFSVVSSLFTRSHFYKYWKRTRKSVVQRKMLTLTEPLRFMPFPVTTNTAVLFCILLLLPPLQVYFYLRWTSRHTKVRLRAVTILVLGDIGRSPRMMYHAQSFAEQLKFDTRIVGYTASRVIPALEMEPKVTIQHLPSPPPYFIPLPFLIRAPIKVLHQCMALYYELAREPTEYLLVQNPPSIPTLPIVFLICHLFSVKLIVDWHNLGFSILALRFPNRPNNPLVRLAKWIEGYFGRRAYAHIFVTHKMKEWLEVNWNIVGKKVVLHDRPPNHFHPMTAQEKHDLFAHLFRSSTTFSSLDRDWLPPYDLPYDTPFTTTRASPHNPASPSLGAAKATIATRAERFEETAAPQLREDRPAVMVSSTSWTSDEDFSILLDAMKIYEEAMETGVKLLVIITGKGPDLSKFKKMMKEKEVEKWKWVKIVAGVWVEASMYPVLLGSCDIGLSLHTSSSGIDLPMKAVDMLGCGLPVCAVDFPCLSELVKHAQNGMVFKDAEGLAQVIQGLLKGFQGGPSELEQLTERTRSWRENGEEWGTWEDNWNRCIKPLLTTTTY